MLLVGLATTIVAVTSHADTKLQFALDWKFEGPSALFFTGLERGYYTASGLNITIDS